MEVRRAVTTEDGLGEIGGGGGEKCVHSILRSGREKQCLLLLSPNLCCYLVVCTTQMHHPAVPGIPPRTTGQQLSGVAWEVAGRMQQHSFINCIKIIVTMQKQPLPPARLGSEEAFVCARNVKTLIKAPFGASSGCKGCFCFPVGTFCGW